MRNSSLFWVVTLLVATACEHTKKPVTSAPNINPTPKAIAAKLPVDSTYEARFYARLEARQRFGAACQRAADENAARLNILYEAHRDSLRRLAPVLARADTTVEGEEFKKGDLNGDGRSDYLVLARGKRPCGIVASAETYCRTVFIIINIKRSGLRVVAANKGLVGCSDCGGSSISDPFHHFTISRRSFSITQLSGDCDRTETVAKFLYSPAQREWLLQARDTWDYSCQENGMEKRVHESPRNFGRVRFANAFVYH